MRERKSLHDRFWSKVRPEVGDACWLWTGAKNSKGYGDIWVYNKGKTQRAHRVSWEMHYGPIPHEALVLHRCDTPSCVRPDHLFVGSPQDNMDDMAAKGRDRKAVGSRNASARLSSDQARAIKARIASGDNMRAMAREFGVSKSTIYAMKIGRSWAWLET